MTELPRRFELVVEGEPIPKLQGQMMEYLPPQLCEETLRKELVAEELQLVDGAIVRPTRPGLGVEPNWDALNAYKVA